MQDECRTGKKIFDKKGARTFKNLSFKLHHIVYQEYFCEWCGGWHVTTVFKNKKNRFRHNL